MILEVVAKTELIVEEMVERQDVTNNVCYSAQFEDLFLQMITDLDEVPALH